MNCCIGISQTQRGLSLEESWEVYGVPGRAGHSQVLERLHELFWYRGRLPEERETEASARLAPLDIEDYLRTGRMRDPETGQFIAKCPLYADHSAPCHRPIGAHYSRIWPELGMPTPDLFEMEGIYQPWSDPRARRMVFGKEGF